MFKTIKNFLTVSIKRQLILGIAFVHIVMMSLFVFDLVSKEKSFLNKQLQKKAISLSKILASNSQVWLLANDYVGLKEVVESIKTHPHVEDILIINPQGQIVAHSNVKFIGKYISDKKSIELLYSHHFSKTIFENNSIIDAASPILRDTQFIGWARVILNKKEINESMAKVTIDGLLYTIVAIILGIIFAYFIANSMSNSIFKIINAIKKTKETEQKHSTNLDRKDEIGILSREFDSMIDTIQQQHQFINSLIDSTPDLIFVKGYKNQAGVYLSCNNAFCEFMGKKKVEILGKTDFELLDKDVAKFFQEKDEQILKEQKSIKNEEWVTYPDGSKVLLETLKTPLYDTNNIFLGVLGVSRNITKKYEIQKELDKKNMIIFQQSKLASLGEMIGNIAHQWRQPLSTISTLASGIKLQKELNLITDEELNKELDNIVFTTQYLSKTIDDFRNFLIHSNNKEEIFYLKEVLEQIKKLMKPALDNNFIKLIIENDDTIKINAIANELVQTLLNLINNAKDALKESNIENKIIIIKTKKIDKNNIEIILLDNGGGIKESIIQRIFEPYFTTKHRSQGTGIGLYMVLQIVTKSLDGTIEVANEEFEYKGIKYKGAKFKILLPLSKN